MTVRLTRIAELELADARSWYEQQRTGLGDRFLDDVAAAVEQIEAYPAAWHPMSRDVRRIRLRTFPYGIYYVVIEADCVVFAVGHLRRSPEHWRQRLGKSTTASEDEA